MNTQLGPTPEQIASMRTAVMHRVAPMEPLTPQPQRPRRVRRFGLVAVGVGALTTALIVASIVMPNDRTRGASAQAVEFLDHAAIETVKTSDPVVGPGQFLRIATVRASGVTDGTREAPMWQHMATDTLYIPSDRSDTWVWERRVLPATVFFSAAGQAAAELGNATVDDDPDLNGVLRARAGAFYGGPARGEGDFDGYSRDPATLRDQFYAAYVGGSSSIDEDVWVRITDLLRTGEVPADLRAALYRTAALVPGVSIVEQMATLDGRTGVALGHTEPARASLMRDEIIIDPQTGQLIGTRGVWLTDEGGLAAGTTYSWSTVQTSVVNAAP
ncbi:CU044_5270 family protein [Microterricola viridarii]|uniref:RNA polymerase sigma-70 factor, ECF subfamily n=1 Tax=Microterricola viridarii TaxID=412690 RepID=A0A1H1X8U7_9MICO|nr:CU044_5270 family protein [Microterricola viridarii]SDT05500.1 RNA polymerase sigma-70 factor, ECF subfamily [Microterricola viridarii]